MLWTITQYPLMAARPVLGCATTLINGTHGGRGRGEGGEEGGGGREGKGRREVGGREGKEGTVGQGRGGVRTGGEGGRER